MPGIAVSPALAALSFLPTTGSFPDAPLQWLFGLGMLWLLYVYLGYPLLLRVSSWLGRIHPRTRGDYFPSVSVLIAARNEEKDIGWKIRETLAWDYPPQRLEVLVASDASEDRTDEIVRGIDDPRLNLVRMERRGGKNRALNRLAEIAQGEILFFTDANSHIAPDCLRRMVRYFADPRVGCVTGDSYSASTEIDSAVGRGTRAYLRHETQVKSLESQLGSVLVCDGAIFCIRRALFTPLAPELANDMELPLRIGAAGYWVLYEPGAQVGEKDTSSPWEEFSRRRRIAAQGVLGMWKLRSTLLSLRGWQFLSHKFLRWTTLVPLVLIFVSSVGLVADPFFRFLLGAQLVGYGLAGAGWLVALAGRDAGRLLSVPFFMLLGVTATFTGVVESCLGRRFAVWEIPALSRGREQGT